MKMFKKLVALIVLTATVLTMAVPTFAATMPRVSFVDLDFIDDYYECRIGVSRKINPYAVRPYKDLVAPKAFWLTVRDTAYLKAHKAFKGVIKGKYFYPRKKYKRKEFIKVLQNLYGKKKVPITKSDKQKWNKKISHYWAMEKLAAVAKNLGVEVRVRKPYMNSTLERGSGSTILTQFCSLHKKLRPRK